MKLSFVFFYALIALFYISTANYSPPPCCNWSGWTYIAPGPHCSALCGPGNITRTRFCECPAGVKSTRCPDPQCTKEVIPCNNGDCCTWGSFGNWSQCVNGSQSRARNCTCRDARTGAVSILSGSAAATHCGSSSSDDCYDDDTSVSSNLETQHCCSWGPWTNGSCSKNCGGGIKTRTRECICGHSRGHTPVLATCVGSAIDSSIACNTFNCCRWGNFSEWTPCNNGTCGGVRTRSAPCNCTNPNPTRSTGSTQVTPQLTCPGSQPIQQEACPGCCAWGNYTEWTQCDKLCNGRQYRRQRCMCSGDDETFCPDTGYDDSRCIGVPQNETRSCNQLGTEDATCCEWAFLNLWSVCVPDNHCCGNGTQWRKQGCVCNGITSDDPSPCIATTGQTTALIETRSCTNGTCCGLQYTDTTCDNLNIDQLEVCVTAPWRVGSCVCSNPTARKICPLDFNNPPVVFNHTSDCPPNPNGYPQNPIQCTEFRYNNTLNAEICYAWEVFVSSANVITQITNPIPALSANLCPPGDCWDGWTDWSACCGTCTAAYRWRVQTATYLSNCRQPPGYQYESCTLDNCCTWIRDDTKAWSDCSSLCAPGLQTRFPYNCSCGETCGCGENSLCGPPPPEEIRTCNASSLCCQFTHQSVTTSCQIISNCAGISWNTQQCTCPDTRGSSTCDIENCYGVPSTSTPPCTCTRTTTKKIMDGNTEMTAKLSSTDEMSNQQSSFLLIFIPTIIVVAIVGIAATLVFIKTRNKLVINTQKSHHRLPNETDNTLV